MKAGYLGPKLSFSHQAAIDIFTPHSSTLTPNDHSRPEIDIEPQLTFADIFEKVQSSQLRYGVVPIENSSNGLVVQSLDLLADGAGKYPDVRVRAEYGLPIHHQLWVKESADVDNVQGEDHSHSSDEGMKTENQQDATKSPMSDPILITDHLYTHPQVWSQCSKFLSHPAYSHVSKQDCASTSEAARMVAESRPGSCAAIASNLAGNEYGLTRKVCDIEDQKDNMTRFLVVAREDVDTSWLTSNWPPSHSQNKIKDGSAPVTMRYKSMVSFVVDPTSPNALTKVLNMFSKYDLNLTSINTRPSRLQRWHYIFVAECERVCHHAHSVQAISKLLADISCIVTCCRHLGTWEDQLRRSSHAVAPDSRQLGTG